MSKFDEQMKALEAETATASGTAEQTSEQAIRAEIARQMPRPDANPLDPLRSLGQGILGFIPGAKEAENKLLGALPGTSEQAMARKQDQLHREQPEAETLGTLGTALVTGVGAGGVLKSALTAAALAPGYKLGEAVHQSQMRADPLRLEQIAHTLFSTETAKEMIEAFGLSTLLGVGPSAVAGGLNAASKGLKRVAGRAAIRQTAPAFVDAAIQSHQPLGGEIDMAQVALDNHMLSNPGRAQALKEQAGMAAATAAEKMQPDGPFLNDLSFKLDKHVQAGNYDPSLRPAQRMVAKYSASLAQNELSAAEVHDLAKSLGAQSRASSGPLSQYYGDAARIMHDGIEGRLKILAPEAAQTYANGNADYYTFAAMEPAARALAKQQVTSGALAKVGATYALASGLRRINPIAGEAAELAAGVAGYSRLQGKNYALLLDKYSKAPPFATFLKHTNDTMKVLFGPATAAQTASSQENAEERYDQISKALREQAINPEKTMEGIRSRLGFLPAHEADAIAANAHEKLQQSTIELPQSAGPATAFGQLTDPSPREKRAFVEKFDCKFDPYKAFKSGRADLVAEAEKHCPETVQHMREQVINEIAKREAAGKPIPYSTKRRLSAILGVAGVPMQDPALGAKLQQAIQMKRQAESQAGQAGSTLQMKAAQKADKATLSRSQQILNNEGQ